MQTLFKPTWQELWRGIEIPSSGTIYTKPEIVELILDLAGYRAEKIRLANSRIIEPSCGDGIFLREIIRRLLLSESAATHGHIHWQSPSLQAAIRAVDIDPGAITHARQEAKDMLVSAGCEPSTATSLSNTWIYQSDFLLSDWEHEVFDFAVGNPPYVRLEDMPSRILAEYRMAYQTATDRADLYIPFIENSLHLLSSRGVMAFICSNRFAKNQYGAAIRKLISSRYQVRHYINLEHTQPFQKKVSAYPSILVITAKSSAHTHAATIEDLSSSTLDKIRTETHEESHRYEPSEWYADGSPWISTSRTRLRTMAELTRNFPAIEDSAPGTKIGIGVATGADDIFVLPNRASEIESSQQLPLLLAQDISSSALSWSGHWLVNPYSSTEQGSVDLLQYPLLAAYFRKHESRLRNRHCAKARPLAWFRTIDRVNPTLLRTPKLVIPDIQAGGIVGYDEGRYYPHHNVYWITSRGWDLRVLQRILCSSFTTEQVRAHSVAMRGGSLRYQAQNLRKIRVPHPLRDKDFIRNLVG